MRNLLAIFTLLILAGCADVVTTRFATLDDAIAQRAFDRGWLPPILPASARNITERNDLDANVGTGSFEFDESERRSYLARLTEAGAAVEARQDSDFVTVRIDRSRWEIELLPEGRARYKMR